jgi:hypothetical protein
MKRSTTKRVFWAGLLALALLAAAPTTEASAGAAVKVRLFSPEALVDVKGTVTLTGQNLSGHLTGDDTDIALTGVVKNQSVSIDLVGRIVPSCGLLRRSMNGVGDNDGEDTSIDMTFHCSSKAGNFGGGQDYQFRLNLALPSRPLYSPSPSNLGESASLD